jgi:hypothetical protein
MAQAIKCDFCGELADRGAKEHSEYLELRDAKAWVSFGVNAVHGVDLGASRKWDVCQRCHDDLLRQYIAVMVQKLEIVTA